MIYSYKSNAIIIIVFFILVTSISSSCLGENVSSYNLEMFIKGAKLGDSLVTSGIGNLTYEWILVDSMNVVNKDIDDNETMQIRDKGDDPFSENYKKVNVNFAFKGIKRRSEIRYNKYFPNTGEVNLHFLKAYNGEQTDFLHLHRTGKNKLICPKGEIFPGKMPLKHLLTY